MKQTLTLEVPIEETAFALVEHVDGLGLARFHGGDRLHQHDPGFFGGALGLLRESCGREYKDCDQRRPPIEI